jgi:hypothetical protein
MIERFPPAMVDGIELNRLRMSETLDPVWRLMSELKQALREKDECLADLNRKERLSWRFLIPNKNVRIAQQACWDLITCQQRAGRSDTKQRLSEAADLSGQTAGILKNILWTVELTLDEWLAVSEIAHRFDKYADELNEYEFFPEQWKEEFDMPEYRNLERIPEFSEEILEIIRRVLKPDLPDEAVACLINEVNRAYRLSQGFVDPLDAYVRFKDKLVGLPERVPARGIEEKVAARALERLRLDMIR